MASKPLPSQAVLNQLLRYEPETGKLFWRPRPPSMFKDGKQSAQWNANIWNSKNAWQEAFVTQLPHGHKYAGLFGRKVLAHRVIWKMAHDVEADEIDHINGDPTDNRMVNLRNVAHADNGRNMKRRKNNTSGHNGVSWSHPHKKWCASIHVDYRKKYLGLFDNIDDAVAARKAAEAHHGFHQNHGRRPARNTA